MELLSPPRMQVDTRYLKNTYIVFRGIITVYPIYDEAEPGRDLGFRLVVEEADTQPFVRTSLASPTIPPFRNFALTPPPETQKSYVPSFVTLNNWVVSQFEAYLCGWRTTPKPPIPQDTEFSHVVPLELHDHIIVVTPPPLSMFPMRYPALRLQEHRYWRSKNDTARTVRTYRLLSLPEVHVPTLSDPTLFGARRAKPGDVIFVNRTAYFLTLDIGELPYNNEFPFKDTIVMEAQSKDRTATILFVPRRYLEPPAHFGEPILGSEEE